LLLCAPEPLTVIFKLKNHILNGHVTGINNQDLSKEADILFRSKLKKHCPLLYIAGKEKKVFLKSL